MFCHAQKQRDRRERGPLDEKFSLRHSASGCKGMGNQGIIRERNREMREDP